MKVWGRAAVAERANLRITTSDFFPLQTRTLDPLWKPKADRDHYDKDRMVSPLIA